jgi:hypothetical protein
MFNNGINHTKLAAAANSSVQKIPLNAMNSESVKKVLDRVWSKFSLSGVEKGTGEINKVSKGYRG